MADITARGWVVHPLGRHTRASPPPNLGVCQFPPAPNCDGLHTLSGLGPDRLAELHGNVFREGCPKCGAEYSRAFYTPDDKASEYFEELRPG